MKRWRGLFPRIPRQDFEKAVHLISPDGSVCAGAEAVFGSMAAGGRERWLLWCYRKMAPFAELTELVYEEVAAHRDFLSRLDRFFLGPDPAPRNYTLVRFVFLRGLALIYLIAFGSLWMQAQGLTGSQGIVPAQTMMGYVKQTMAREHIGADRYHLLPHAGLVERSDGALNWQCGVGVGLSLSLLGGVAPAPTLFLLWAIYLSL